MFIKVLKYISVILCASFLIMPLILFNHKDGILEKENRALPSFPSFVCEGKINYKFFNELDSYISDRFGLRSLLIALNSKVSAKNITSIDGSVLKGKDDFLFYIKGSDGDNLSDFYRRNTLSPEQMQEGLTNILAMKDWCEVQGIKFLLVVCPNKHNIYPENYPFTPNSSPSRASLFTSKLKECGVECVFSYEAIIKEKANYSFPLYYKTDTHWTPCGAYQYLPFIKNALNSFFPKTSFPNISYSFSAKYAISDNDLFRMLVSKESFNDYIVKAAPTDSSFNNSYEYLKDSDKNSIDDHNFTTTSPTPFLPRAVIFRDSFCTALVQFLSPLFSYAHYIWRPFTEDEKEIVLKDGANIVIFQMVERNLWNNINRHFTKN